MCPTMLVEASNGNFVMRSPRTPNDESCSGISGNCRRRESPGTTNVDKVPAVSRSAKERTREGHLRSTRNDDTGSTVALVSSHECVYDRLRRERENRKKYPAVGRVRSRNCVTAAVLVENDRRQKRRGSKEPSWKRRRGHRPFRPARRVSSALFFRVPLKFQRDQ